VTIFARRYNWEETNPLDSSALLDFLVSYPKFLTYPYPPEVARASYAEALINPANFVWVTYSGATLTGVVFLTRVVPNMDALLHFFFLDRSLASKRKLLHNLIGHCFRDLGFHRLSMEVPERIVNLDDRLVVTGTRLERFARKALGFRLEGEIRNRLRELPDSLTNEWVARQGARREQSYFDGKTWSDIVLLRLLASEWVGTGEREAKCLGTFSHLLPAPSSEGSSVAEAPVTPSPSSPRTSSPSDSRTSGSSSTS
jgi:hypothetical protein